MTVTTVNRTSINSARTAKMGTLEGTLKTRIDAVAAGSGDVTQGEMLALQFEIQGFTHFVQTIATVQKEFSDMLKGITSKI